MSTDRSFIKIFKYTTSGNKSNCLSSLHVLELCVAGTFEGRCANLYGHAWEEWKPSPRNSRDLRTEMVFNP